MSPTVPFKGSVEGSLDGSVDGSSEGYVEGCGTSIISDVSSWTLSTALIPISPPHASKNASNIKTPL